MSERYPRYNTSAGSGTSGDALDYLWDQMREERSQEYKGNLFRLGRDGSARFLREEDKFYRNPKSTPALEAAVLAFQKHINKEEHMSTNLVKNESGQTRQISLAEKFGYTEKQLDLVKRTVAKNATDDELELFFYRCKELQLNPLMPGQVYFLKFGNNPGSVIVGLDGFRARAQRTGKLAGIKRGVVRDNKGICVGGWADVYRKDWDHPAHEEVSLHEYADSRKPIWKNMPETMIKKVAEVAALRMAFPDELGGIYSPEEMDQADKGSKPVSCEVERKPSEAQLKRLFAISKAAGLSHDELRNILAVDYEYESSKELNLEEYNELCSRLEAKTITIANKDIGPVLPVPKAIQEREFPDDVNVPNFNGDDNDFNDSAFDKEDPRLMK